MTDVDALFRQYVEEHRSGGPADPLDYLARVEGTARAELGALIDGYLARARRQAWDPEAYERSGAPDLVDTLGRALGGAGGLWPARLPQLRHQAELSRSELVERLAGSLGVRAGALKVRDYYHRMELGSLPAEGVSERVLEALGRIVGVSAEQLRRWGRALEPGAGDSAESAVFARLATPDPEQQGPAPETPGVAEEAPPAEEWDEVDRLFRGG